MKQHRTLIYDAAIGLAAGQSVRVSCPYCEATHERSLCVTRLADRILYVCPRAKCGSSGAIYLVGNDIYRSSTDRAPRHAGSNYFGGDTVAMPDALCDWLRGRYQTVDPSWLYDPINHRLIMPLKDRGGVVYGHAAKRLPDIEGVGTKVWKGPKVVNYATENFGHFVGGHDKKLIVLVEDVISATKVGDACALLGTSISGALAYTLVRNYDNWLLLLDPDATHKARKIKQLYKPMVRGKILITELTNDPKDTPASRLQELVRTALYAVGEQ